MWEVGFLASALRLVRSNYPGENVANHNSYTTAIYVRNLGRSSNGVLKQCLMLLLTIQVSHVRESHDYGVLSTYSYCISRITEMPPIIIKLWKSDLILGTRKGLSELTSLDIHSLERGCGSDSGNS